MSRLILLTLLTLLTMGVCGCEGDRESTVVNEAPEQVINVPTNGTVASVDVTGNQNTTVVYVEVAPGVTQVFDVDVTGNSNFVGIVGISAAGAAAETEPGP
jgi:hypothetical protein